MKTVRYLTLCLLAVGLLIPVHAQDALTESLQRGLFEEEANRDLEAAATAYQEVVANWDGQRALASTGIYRLGEVYRKLGRLDEAAEQYRRIVDEFSDQETLVTLSRQNLTGMGFADASGGTVAAANLAPAPLSQSAKDEMVKLVEEEISLLEEELKAAESLIQNGLRPPSEPAPLRREILSLRRELVRLNDAPVLGETTASAASLITSEEEQEIQRIRALIANSPDLSNAVTGSDEDKGTPLQKAARAGHLKVAEFLLENGADVNLQPNPPIYEAVQAGHKAMVELLLKNGADVNGMVNGRGYTPLYYAAENGFSEVAQVLLENGARVNAQINSGMTPLYAAAREGKERVVQILIDNGADVNIATDSGETPLHQAAGRGSAEIAELLLKNGADVDATVRMSYSLTIPSLPSNQLLERDLLRRTERISVNVTPLYSAVNSGNTALVELLLEYGAITESMNSANADTPLGLAVSGGKTDMVKILLDHGANPNATSSRFLGVFRRFGRNSSELANDCSLLHLAVERGNVEIAKLLIDAGADVNAHSREGITPIYLAVDKNFPEIVELLLENGAEPEVSDVEDVTSLFRAIQNNSLKIAELILKAGADVNQFSERDGTPLHFAVRRFNTEMIELLLSFDLDLEIRHRGFTPLHTAMSFGSNISESEATILFDIATLLLDAGADIEAVNTASGDAWSGNTPLVTAVIRRHDQLVQILLERGANPNAMNEQGETPLSILTVRGSNGATAQVLRQLPPRAAESATGPRIIGRARVVSSENGNPTKLVELLLEHGANPYLDRMNYISLRRDSSSEPVRVFRRDKREVNQFTIFELVMAEIMRSRLAFPDYENVSIGRITSDTGEEQIVNVDLREIMESGNTKGDIYLKWGDIVTIPETNHPVNAEWRIPSSETLRFLNDILERNVIVMIQNQRHEIMLDPEFYSYPGMSLSQRQQEIRSTLEPGEPQPLLRSAELKLVLERSNLLLRSSDLTRVTVTRTNPETGVKFTMEYNLEETEYPDDLWLRDGDIIEVPDKE